MGWGQGLQPRTALTVEQARAMPGAFTAHRRVDGEELYDGITWVMGGIDWLDDNGDPCEVEEIIMVPFRVRTFWVGCHEFVACDDAPDECEGCSGPPGGPSHDSGPEGTT